MDAPLRWVKDASSITIGLPQRYQGREKPLQKASNNRE